MEKNHNLPYKDKNNISKKNDTNDTNELPDEDCGKENVDQKNDLSTSEVAGPECDGDSEEISETQKAIDSYNISPVLIQEIKRLLDEKVGQILSSFEQKLAYDSTKQQQIDRLHGELQKHSSDLIAKTSMPYVNGIIRLYDDIGKSVENLQKKSSEELGPDQFFPVLKGIQEDVEILLDQNGIVSYTEISDKFDPKRQRVISKVDTQDEHLVGTVAKRLRPGFERSDDVIQKERVNVYVLSEATDQLEGKPGINEIISDSD